MKRLSILLVLLLLFTSFSFGAFADGLTPGTYEGSAQSVGGPIRVSVSLSFITALPFPGRCLMVF